jgi:hypothetical protein
MLSQPTHKPINFFGEVPPMKKQFRLHLIVIVGSLLAVSTQAAFCQAGSSDSPSDTPPRQSPPAPSATTQPAERDYVGVGVKVSTLGVGAEVAARVTHRANVRAGFNVLGYSRTFTKDGIPYDGHLDFRTVEGHFDFFPWGGRFHVSPGILGYIGDPITAHASIPGGQSFTLGGVTFYSDTTNPTHGSGKIDFNGAAPMITFGWGNLVPRSHKHFSVPVEFGIAFQGSAKSTLNLAGNVCTSSGVNCRDAATDPTVQTQILSEQNKLNNSMSFFQVYPVISVGVGYKF